MLRALASLSPVVVLLLGAVPAALGGWFAGAAKFALVDAPQIRAEASAAAEVQCALRVTLAANAAEKAERDRQKQVSSDALAAYRAALANSERTAAMATERLERDIADYETQLVEQGRFCGITQPDIDFMYGRSPPGGPIRR